MSVKRKPDFLYVGGQRCGSTLLHTILKRNPSVFVAKPVFDRWKKEIKFFSHEILNHDLRWYEAHFEPAEEGQVCGELTPGYGPLEPAMVRLTARYLGRDTRLLYCIRRPDHRAFSHFKMSLSGFGRKSLNPERVNLQALVQFCHDWRCISQSRQSKAIETWSQYFRKSALKLFIFDDFIARPEEVVREICAHIGAAPASDDIPSERVHASGGPEATPEMRRYLSLRWLPEARLLNRLLSGGIDHWIQEMTREAVAISTKEHLHFRTLEVLAIKTRLSSRLKHLRRMRAVEERLSKMLAEPDTTHITY